MSIDHLVPDPTLDPQLRCFGGPSPLYQAYHDWEWGEPVHGDDALFERLSLEVFAAGLSWLIVLRKREAFRAAWAGFDPTVVAAYGQSDVDRLMADPALVRNRRKIEATIANAQAIVGLHSGGTCLDDVIWGFRPTAHPRPRTFADVPSSTPQSTALAGELRRLGVRWIGPVIAYATMQACGLVNDHIEGCPRAMSG